MTRVALIEYFTSSSGTLIFLAKEGLAEPLVFPALIGAQREPLTRDDLQRCSQRLILDFHGLPPGWDDESERGRFKELLSLPPAVNANKRTKEVNRINLHKPAFSYDLTYLDNLSEALLPPDLRAQIEDCDLLCFVPHGPLHSLPFAALRWSAEQYLIERFGICYVQSASILQYCQYKNRKRLLGSSHEPQNCLIAAVAAADDEDAQEFEADGEMLAELFRERGTTHDDVYLIGAHPTDDYQPASKELIKKLLGGHDVIHFACHGVFGADAGGDPLDSGLLVSDGETTLALSTLQQLDATERASHFLSAREIFGLELTADLVTLRACSSGRAELQVGDELFGLTRAFLYAGAPSLLVSLWNVNKRSSQRLLNEFYRFWLDPQQPLPKWQALQKAQQSLMQDPEYQHPYHWAPFILLGDWL
jgi:CHAT domain-containing protein